MLEQLTMSITASWTVTRGQSNPHSSEGSREDNVYLPI